MITAILLSDESVPWKILSWLSELLYHPQGALLSLVGRVEVGHENLPEDTVACKR